MSKWHVVENTPGYLPESEPTCFVGRKNADAHARSLAQELRDLGYRVTGNPHIGYYAERSRSDLGRVIEVLPCEEDCEDSVGED